MAAKRLVMPLFWHAFLFFYFSNFCMSLINYVVCSQWFFMALLQDDLRCPPKGWCVIHFYLYDILIKAVTLGK